MEKTRELELLLFCLPILRGELMDTEQHLDNIEPDHICGPESHCDSNCSDFASGCLYSRKLRDVIEEIENATK